MDKGEHLQGIRQAFLMEDEEIALDSRVKGCFKVDKGVPLPSVVPYGYRGVLLNYLIGNALGDGISYEQVIASLISPVIEAQEDTPFVVLEASRAKMGYDILMNHAQREKITRPRVILATGEEQYHDLGILALAILLRKEGFKTNLISGGVVDLDKHSSRGAILQYRTEYRLCGGALGAEDILLSSICEGFDRFPELVCMSSTVRIYDERHETLKRVAQGLSHPVEYAEKGRLVSTSRLAQNAIPLLVGGGGVDDSYIGELGPSLNIHYASDLSAGVRKAIALTSKN